MKNKPVILRALLLLIGLCAISVSFVFLRDLLTEQGVDLGALPTVILLGIPSWLLYKKLFPSSKTEHAGTGSEHKSIDTDESSLHWSEKNKWK
jgi:hypothetical protein